MTLNKLVLVTQSITDKSSVDDRMFGNGLQNALKLVMLGGLTKNNEIPILISPVHCHVRFTKKRYVTQKGVFYKDHPSFRFTAKIAVRDDFNPSELWLRFNKMGTSVSLSADAKQWLSIVWLKHLQIIR